MRVWDGVCDVCPHLSPPLLFIEGRHGVLGRGLDLLHLEPPLSSNEELPRWRRRSVGPTMVRPTLVNLAPTDLSLCWVAAMWILLTCAACPKSVCLLWWAHESSCLRLIGWEGVASDWECATLFIGCASFSFPKISNLYTNIHQHFVKIVSNNSYH